MADIETKKDVKVFVDAFYAKVQKDTTIGPVFAEIIPDGNWAPHLERMYSFWNTVLFAVKDYHGNPFAKHAPLPLKARHFERWVSLFVSTIDEYFEGEKAEDAKGRAIKMGKLFQAKMEYIQANNNFKNIL